MLGNQPRKQRRPRRRGTITVLTALLMIGLIGMVAFSVDLGYLINGREELQRTADAAALAAVWELAENSVKQNSSLAMSETRAEAVAVAFENDVCKVGPMVDLNSANGVDGDVVIGTINDFSTPSPQMTFVDADDFNAVKVRVLKTNSRNGDIPYFFGRVFGLTGQETEASATAAMVKLIRGFEVPADGSNLDILPFALDELTWNLLMAKSATLSDQWSYNEDTGAVSPGCDGILEVNLFPQATGSPGNRGTVDIGPSNNSTSDIAYQILHGVSPADIAAIGGSICIPEGGDLVLNGDTGISAGVKDELASIIGETRIIPIFSHVVGPGNNADFHIVKWCGVRIMEVKLTGPGSKKKVLVQPAVVCTSGVVPSTTTGYTDFVYSPAFLVE